MYVVDEANRSFQKFDSNGNFIAKWDQPPPGTDGQLGEPWGIDIDSSNMVYITDVGLFRIQKFTSDGSFVTKWGSEGPQDGQFKKPTGVAVDSSGKVFVADTLNYRIQVFSQITDTVPPIVTVPPDKVVQATSSSGVVVTYDSTAHDNVDGDLTPTCNPPSGSTFAIGSTNVICTAVDKAGNKGTASFNILVKESPNPSRQPTSLILRENRPVAPEGAYYLMRLLIQTLKIFIAYYKLLSAFNL